MVANTEGEDAASAGLIPVSRWIDRTHRVLEGARWDEITTRECKAPGMTCDPITLEIVSGALKSTLREMEAMIERTAMSPFIREKKDFNTGLFDSRGRLIVSPGVTTLNILEPILERYSVEDMLPGDIYWYNDCYGSKGAVSHTPDQVFVRPVFADGRVRAFVQSWAHFNDIGGMRPGTLSPECTDIFQEGTIVPPVRLARNDEINEDLLRIFSRNSRFPAMLTGDVRALLAAVRLGERRMNEVFSRFGLDQMESAFQQILDVTRNEVISRLRGKLADGEYSFTELLDSDGHGGGPFNITFKLKVSDNSVVFDATESADQCKGPFNFLMATDMPAAMFAQVLLEGDQRYSINGGVADLFDEVRLREGSILAPTFPAALGLRGVTVMRASAAWFGIMAQATDGNINASSCAFVVCYLRGSDDNGTPFLLTDPLGLGYGARPYADGNDGIYLAANENYPAEFVEASFPMRIQGYALAKDSGGAGRWRGGCGIIRDIEVLAPQAMLGIRMDSVDFPPWGVNGGMSGGRGACIINPGTPDEVVVNPVSDGTIVKRGDIVRIITGGGGGWGHPHDREPERVLDDVLDDFVSKESARRDYGVLITDDGEIDVAGTAGLRSRRPETKLFHRNKYCESL